ncbi:GvpT/GvpP family gas vesicle accessory protein [Virgibacillus halophilus]|uniref:GvpT/GvpP family gas vesicle accessory protein n=1 Tax=Tigheibacillus halophilus TaxID=361280 RepID=A0ABU5C6X4_9BACI|nr:GvpT/GvpP family gas vesicle accessory protein [Virgibacillus halophilus]
MTDQTKTNQTQPAVNPAIIGGVVGTGVGLLASANTGKKIVSKIGQSAMLQKAGKELCETAQELIYDQAKIMLKQSLSNSLTKYQQKIFHPLQEQKAAHRENDAGKNEPQTDMTDQYKELKEENKELNENLNRIEDKLNKLLQAMEQ